jgi:hypothetical protein
MQQSGVGGKAFQVRDQCPVCRFGVARPQELTRQRKGLLDVAVSLNCDHKITL